MTDALQRLPESKLLELGESLLKEGKSISFVARGRSMQPSIEDGDLVRIKPLEKRLPNIGDIVFFRGPAGVPTLHRLLRIEGEQFVFRGDALSRVVERVEREQVLGVLESLERNGKLIHDKGWHRAKGMLHAKVQGLRWLCYSAVKTCSKSRAADGSARHS